MLFLFAPWQYAALPGWWQLGNHECGRALGAFFLGHPRVSGTPSRVWNAQARQCVRLMRQVIEPFVLDVLGFRLLP